MKMLIIPVDRVEKLKNMEFPKPHKLDPVKGELSGNVVYFLQAELKEEKTFEKALADFQVCEIKEIETVETKSYDSKGVVTTDETKAVTTKTILTETIIKEPIKEPIK